MGARPLIHGKEKKAAAIAEQRMRVTSRAYIAEPDSRITIGGRETSLDELRRLLDAAARDDAETADDEGGPREDANRVELRVTSASFAEFKETVNTMAEVLTAGLFLEHIRKTYGNEVFEGLIRDLAHRQGGPQDSERQMENLSPAIRGVLASPELEPVKALFDNTAEERGVRNVIHLRRSTETFADLGMALLLTALNKKFNYTIVSADGEDAEMLEGAIREYAEQKLNVILGDNFHVVALVRNDIGKTLQRLMVPGELNAVVADEIYKTALEETWRVLPDTLWLVDNSELTSSEEVFTAAALLDELSYEMTQALQNTEDHLTGTLAEAMTRVQAMAAILRAA